MDVLILYQVWTEQEAAFQPMNQTETCIKYIVAYRKYVDHITLYISGVAC